MRLPLGTKRIHAGTFSWGINFTANTCGACIRTLANTGKYLWGIIFRILAKLSREFILVGIHVAPVFAPARIQEKFLANYIRPALSGGMDWWHMEWPSSRVRKNIFQRPKFPGKCLKFHRKSDFRQISGSEIWKFRAQKMQFHTPSHSIPPLDSLLIIYVLVSCLVDFSKIALKDALGWP